MQELKNESPLSFDESAPVPTPADGVQTVSTEIPSNGEKAAEPMADPAAPEAPKKRETAEIQKEYQYLCFQAGEIQYQILMMEQALGRVNARIQMINNEASQREAEENKKKMADAANQAKQAAENKAKAEAKRAAKGEAKAEAEAQV